MENRVEMNDGVISGAVRTGAHAAAHVAVHEAVAPEAAVSAEAGVVPAPVSSPVSAVAADAVGVVPAPAAPVVLSEAFRSGHQRVLTVAELGKEIHGRTLWSGVNFVAKPGEITVLHGKSGAGKTTLLNCVGMLDAPTSGSIRWDDRELTKVRGGGRRKLYRYEIAFVLQNLGLVDEFTVSQNLLMGLKYQKGVKNKKAMIAEALAAVRLEGREKQKVFELSGGEQQRVAFARAMLQRPSLLLVDEPTASLDEGNSEHIYGLMRAIAAAGAVVLVSTHDALLIERADQRILLGAE